MFCDFYKKAFLLYTAFTIGLCSGNMVFSVTDKLIIYI